MATAKVYVYLKEGILDPQGKAVLHILQNMDVTEVEDVRVGKMVTLKFRPGLSQKEIAEKTEEICKKLLANPVIEDYHFEIELD
ncbi:MAG TPA: phosphoribosylformylglycinamidine synthase subunit PurS [Bacteroidetes bacterium]|nr:phosphoribosylformylglycinamidine synthase subunit PurS [Bacteroidota bacterium]